MRITFLVDNLPHPTLPLLTEHGLSLYIETDDLTNRRIGESTNRKIGILCDMGASGAYIKNAKALGIDLNACHWAFLSHAHADHTGGLGKWIAQHGHIPVYASHHIATDEYFSSRPKRVEGQKSKVESQCKVTDESLKVAIKREHSQVYLAMPSESNFMKCEALNNRVIDESLTIQRERSEQINDSTSKRERSEQINDSAIQHSQSDLRYIGTDLNLFHGHTPWYKPIEQNTWLTPHIALVHPTCNLYPKPLGNKYLTVVEGQCKVTDESYNRLIDEPLTIQRERSEQINDSTSKRERSEQINDSAIQRERSEQINDSAIQHKRSENDSPHHQITASPERSENDPFLHEIALCFVTPKGLVIVSCCSHHGALNTIASCMEFTGCNTLHAYIGGLHFVDSPQVEAETTSFINDWLTLYPNAHLYTGHCTCPLSAALLKAHLPHCHTFYTGMMVEV